jgi:hypothetical protein
MSTPTAHLARRRLAAVAAAAATAALLATASPAAAPARASASTADGTPAGSGAAWGTAIEVPGSATLNTKGEAYISSLSCATTGNCSAGGFYIGSASGQLLVVSQVHGRWGTAKEVPGIAALDAGGDAQIYSLSCASAGNCSAGGYYADSSGHIQAFVVSQVHGRWGRAKEVAATLNTGNGAGIQSLSCASVGNCSAGGTYTDGSGHGQAFVVSEVNGRWGTAKEVAATLNTGGGAVVYSLSCASAGNCSAGGNYKESSAYQAFVVNQVNGKWGTAKEVPGTATLNTGGQAAVYSLSCARAGTCSAGGIYRDSSGWQAFVVSQT